MMIYMLLLFMLVSSSDRRDDMKEVHVGGSCQMETTDLEAQHKKSVFKDTLAWTFTFLSTATSLAAPKWPHALILNSVFGGRTAADENHNKVVNAINCLDKSMKDMGTKLDAEIKKVATHACGFQQLLFQGNINQLVNDAGWMALHTRSAHFPCSVNSPAGSCTHGEFMEIVERADRSIGAAAAAVGQIKHFMQCDTSASTGSKCNSQQKSLKLSIGEMSQMCVTRHKPSKPITFSVRGNVDAWTGAVWENMGDPTGRKIKEQWYWAICNPEFVRWSDKTMEYCALQYNGVSNGNADTIHKSFVSEVYTPVAKIVSTVMDIWSRLHAVTVVHKKPLNSIEDIVNDPTLDPRTPMNEMVTILHDIKTKVGAFDFWTVTKDWNYQGAPMPVQCSQMKPGAIRTFQVVGTCMGFKQNRADGTNNDYWWPEGECQKTATCGTSHEQLQAIKGNIINGIKAMEQMLKFGISGEKPEWQSDCTIVENGETYDNSCAPPISYTSDINSICPLNTVVQNDETFEETRIAGVTQNCGFANYRCTTHPEECYQDMNEAVRRRWFFQNTNCCSSTPACMEPLCKSCDISGTEKKVEGTFTLEECKQQCLNDANCKGIDYGRSEGIRAGQCYINTGQGQKFTSHSKFDGWTRKEECRTGVPDGASMYAQGAECSSAVTRTGLITWNSAEMTAKSCYEFCRPKMKSNKFYIGTGDKEGYCYCEDLGKYNSKETCPLVESASVNIMKIDAYNPENLWADIKTGHIDQHKAVVYEGTEVVYASVHGEENYSCADMGYEDIQSPEECEKAAVALWSWAKFGNIPFLEQSMTDSTLRKNLDYSDPSFPSMCYIRADGQITFNHLGGVTPKYACTSERGGLKASSVDNCLCALYPTSGYSIYKRSAECSNNDLEESQGSGYTAKTCYERCRDKSNMFLIGTGSKSGICWCENTGRIETTCSLKSGSAVPWDLYHIHDYAAKFPETKAVTTSGGDAAEGSTCVFPFTYKGKTYNKCTKKNNNDKLWCYTDDNGNWGNCVVSEDQTRTLVSTIVSDHTSNKLSMSSLLAQSSLIRIFAFFGFVVTMYGLKSMMCSKKTDYNTIEEV